MPNQLTDAQRSAPVCPDCGDNPDEFGSHLPTCRRIAMAMPVPIGPDRSEWSDPTLDLQCGPPWADWPEGVEPVNPLAQVH